MARTFSHIPDPHYVEKANTSNESDAGSIPEMRLTDAFDDGTKINIPDKYLSFENAEDFDKYFYSSPILLVYERQSAYRSVKYAAFTYPFKNTQSAFDHVDIILCYGHEMVQFRANIIEHKSKKYLQLTNYANALHEEWGHLITSLPEYPSPEDSTQRDGYWLGFDIFGNLEWQAPVVKRIETDEQTVTQWGMLESATIAGVGSTVGSESCFTQSFPLAFMALMIQASAIIQKGGSVWIGLGNVSVSISSINIEDHTALLNYSLINSGNTYLMNVIINENSITLCAKLVATS